MFREKNRNALVSLYTYRQLIGILGMLLPLFCILGGRLFGGIGVQKSVSIYYHGNMRDWFIGLMFAVSFFLITYKGHEVVDNLITTVAGSAGLTLAIFPCFDSLRTDNPSGIFQISSKTSNTVHLISAALFFAVLSLYILFVFTLTDEVDEIKNRQKRRRNRVYRICGVAMLVSLVTLLVLFLTVNQKILDRYKIVLILETVMLAAFGFSWLVKGEALWGDRTDDSKSTNQSGSILHS